MYLDLCFCEYSPISVCLKSYNYYYFFYTLSILGVACLDVAWLSLGGYICKAIKRSFCSGRVVAQICNTLKQLSNKLRIFADK